MLEKPKTKVIAIAKDEAAYIPEWIFHHLNFEFDEIEVITNRTTDNSKEVLKKISSKFPQVKHSDCSWIDFCDTNINKHLQKIAYANAYGKAKEDGFTHILFIDIDELWTPIDLKTKINDFIESRTPESSISFQWICELGVEEKFASLQREGIYTLNSHVKTLIYRDSKFRKIRVHTPDFHEDSRHILADNKKYIPQEKNPELCHPGTLGIKEAFIIHRIYRSETEYIATLIRGNPENKEVSLKENRNGFSSSHSDGIPVKFDKTIYDTYISNLNNFITECNIRQELEDARNTTLNRSNQAITVIKNLAAKKTETIRRIFSGIKCQEVLNILESLPSHTEPQPSAKSGVLEAFKSLPQRIQSPLDSGEILREIALSFESLQDYHNAYEVMSAASIIRPNGPIINSKKSLYKSKLQNKK